MVAGYDFRPIIYPKCQMARARPACNHGPRL